jgi:AcrR family transcriptional regulator
LKSSSEYIKEYLGSLSALSKALGINKTTLWDWSKSKHLLQLESLLKLCYQFEVSLPDFVTGEIIRKSSIASGASSPEKAIEITPPAGRKALDKREAQRILRSALKEIPPAPLQDVAARLGRDANTLRYWFADLCKAIVTRYAEYEEACYARKWKDIESALRSALDDDEPLSMAQIALQLGRDIKTLTKRHPELCRKISARHSENRRTRWVEIQVKLQSVLIEQPPPSVLKVAGRLGLSKSSLYKHLPNLCHQIAERFISYRRRLVAR